MVFIPHGKLTFGGTWDTDDDQGWSCGIALDWTGDGEFGDSDIDTYGAYAQPYVKAWFIRATSLIPPDCTLTWCKFVGIGASGDYATDPYVYDYVPSVAGAGAANGQCGFTTLAITLESANSRPPGRYGRFYPPGITTLPDYTMSAFQAPSAAVADVSQSAGTLLHNLIQSTWHPCIASKVGTGQNPHVVSVSTDSVFDVQRRRKNKIRGARVFATTFP